MAVPTRLTPSPQIFLHRLRSNSLRLHGFPRTLHCRQIGCALFRFKRQALAFSRPLTLVFPTAKQGTQVVVPYRDEDDKRHLKVTGDLGQVVPMVRPSASAREFQTQDLTLADSGMEHEERHVH